MEEKREKEKKVKKHYLKVCSMIAILSIFIIGAFFNSNLASASEGNAFESIFKYFETKLLSNSNGKRTNTKMAVCKVLAKFGIFFSSFLASSKI